MPKCWARILGDCAGPITKEHIVTERVFPEKTVTVRGLPWCREEYKTISIVNYKASILCEKHNNALSPVDDAGILFADRLRGMVKIHRERSSLISRAGWSQPFYVYDYSFNGPLLERWFLKTLINYEMVGKQHIPIGPKGTVGEPPKELVEVAFGRQKFDAPTGLYLIARRGDVLGFDDRIHYTSLIAMSDDREFIGGGRFNFHGLELALFLGGQKIPRVYNSPDGPREVMRHPRQFDVNIGEGRPSQRMYFDWTSKVLPSFPIDKLMTLIERD